jgi:hypothetical protein
MNNLAFCSTKIPAKVNLIYIEAITRKQGVRTSSTVSKKKGVEQTSFVKPSITVESRLFRSRVLYAARVTQIAIRAHPLCVVLRDD